MSKHRESTGIGLEPTLPSPPSKTELGPRLSEPQPFSVLVAIETCISSLGSFLKQVLQRHVLHVLTVLLALCLHNVVLNYVNTHYKDSASVMMTTNILTLSLSSTISPHTHRSKAENVHQDPS